MRFDRGKSDIGNPMSGSRRQPPDGSPNSGENVLSAIYRPTGGRSSTRGVNLDRD